MLVWFCMVTFSWLCYETRVRLKTLYIYIYWFYGKICMYNHVYGELYRVRQHLFLCIWYFLWSILFILNPGGEILFTRVENILYINLPDTWRYIHTHIYIFIYYMYYKTKVLERTYCVCKSVHNVILLFLLNLLPKDTNIFFHYT